MFHTHHLRPRTALHPLTTAHLAQTMALLELNAIELDQKIESDLANNPALDVKDTRHCPQCGFLSIESGFCPRCTASQNQGEPIVFVSPRQDFYRRGLPEKGDFLEDEFPQPAEDLPAYVFRQIAPELSSDDHLLAAYLLSNLDEDGLLNVPLVEVVRYHHVSLSRVEAVMRLIQRADPVGVGSPSSQEALLVQLDVLKETQPVPPLAEQAIHQGLDLLSRHQYVELGRLIGASSRQVEQLARFISENLNPFPGRACWGDIRHGKGVSPPVYNFPDVVITPLNEGPEPILMVEVVSPYAGMLRINPLFRQALSDAPNDKADQWRSDLEYAELLVKCLQQRTNTLVRLITRIVVLQREYILHGDEHLLPLTRASLADDLNLHESTISRAVGGKTVQLPNSHIVPLAKFFDRSLNVRTTLKHLIAQEAVPLSDSELVDMLNRLGYSVARRTVAKYRAMEGILPSHLRKNHQINETL